jgi:hypothetical protein
MIGRIHPRSRVCCALLLALPLALAPTMDKLAAFGLIVVAVALSAGIGLRRWLFA